MQWKSGNLVVSLSLSVHLFPPHMQEVCLVNIVSVFVNSWHIHESSCHSYSSRCKKCWVNTTSAFVISWHPAKAPRSLLATYFPLIISMRSNKPIILWVYLFSKIFSISKKKANYKLRNHIHCSLALLQSCNNYKLITHIEQKLHAWESNFFQTGCKIVPIGIAGKR